MRIGDGDAYTAILMALADAPGQVDRISIRSVPERGIYKVIVSNGYRFEAEEIHERMHAAEAEYRTRSLLERAAIAWRKTTPLPLPG